MPRGKQKKPKLPLFSAEGLASFIVAVVAVTVEMTWWVRGILVILAIAAAAHLAWRIPANLVLRIIATAAGVAVLIFLTWQPIWEGYTGESFRWRNVIDTTPSHATPEIYPGVIYPNKLGAYVREDVSRGSYEAGYENATVFWDLDSGTFYILSVQSQKWVEQKEPSTPKDLKYWDERYLRTIFPRAPKDKLPPYAGLATLWQDDPKKWRALLGWRQWHCALTETHFQEFQNGWAVGVLLNSPNPAADRGVVWFLYKDGTWDQQFLEAASVPECKPL